MIRGERERKKIRAGHVKRRARAAKRRKCDSLVERVTRIETALAEEQWLSIGLRGLLALEMPQVKNDLREGRRDRAQSNVHRLALVSFRYGPGMLDSEAVAQLRVLDLELSVGQESRFSRNESRLGGSRFRGG